MIREAENLVGQALGQLLAGKTTFGEIKNTTRDVLSQYFYRKTKRNPMIIPVIMNKKIMKKIKNTILLYPISFLSSMSLSMVYSK